MISVLFVDDEIELIRLSKIFLERLENFSVDICSSASESLKRLESRPYDAIVSDYQMPGMNGIDLLKAVRVRFGDIPFILFTGRGREEVVIQAINNGADFYLQKGGDPKAQFAELAHKIRQAVRRKEAERSLQDSEKRQSDIIEFLPDATFAIDQAGRVIAWNRAIEEMTGVSSSEMLGKGDYEYSIPFYGYRRPVLIDMIDGPEEEISRLYSNAFRKGNSLSAETSLAHPKEKPMSVQIKVSRLFNKSGENIGAIESIRDITEIRDTQRSLSKSREEYRRIIETAQEGIWEIDSSHRTVFVNTQVARMLGYPIEEIIGRPYTDFILPDDLPGLLEKIEGRGIGVSSTNERRFFHKNGGIIWTNLYAVPIWDGDTIVGSFGTIIDITERKKAEEELALSEREFRALFENTAASTVIIEKDTTISRANEAYARLIKLPRDEIEGRVKWSEFVCPEDREFMLEYHRKRRGDGDSAPLIYEFCLKDSEGRIHPMMAHVGMIPGTLKSVASLIDITPLKETEQELIRKSEELMASNLQLTAAEEELRRQYSILAENEVILKQSKQQLEDIASHIPGVLFQAVVSSFEDLRMVYVSCGMYEFFGIHSDDQNVFRHFSAMIHPHDNASFISSVQTAIKNQSDWQYEGRFQKSDKEILWFSGAASCSCQDSEIIYNGVLLDITDKKAAQLDLKASEERFRGMAERSSDLILILDPELRITYASPSARSIIGYDPEELIGRSQDFAAETFFSQSSAEFFETLQKIRDQKSTENLEIRVRKKDNTPVFVSLYAVPIIHDGTFAGLQISMRVITSVRKIRKALKKSEEKFRRFVENANEIVFSLTPEGIFSYITPNIKDLLGYEISEVIGKPFSLLIFPDDYPKTMDSFTNTSTTGKKIGGIEYRIRHKHGNWIWVSQSFSPILTVEGNIAEIQGICYDITERKRSEEALRRANRQINLLSSVTRHDILNEVNVALLYIDEIGMKCHDTEIYHGLQMMESSIRIIQSHIEFTRIYEDLGSHDPQWIEPDAILPRSHLPGSVSLSSGLQGIVIYVDPMFDRVFFNLLDNSLRHGEWVSAIRVSAEGSDGNLTIIWEDNGIGIAQKDKEKIFDRGFGNNTGFGLFLVREILSLTGITIRETGVQGKGARFEINVPRGAFRYQTKNHQH